MWMIDIDYDEKSCFVRHAYFLGAIPYERLKRALKAINHYGDELLTVLDLPTPSRG